MSDSPKISFESLGLIPQIVEPLTEKGYQSPSPIQAAAIPPALDGHDLLAAAQTGTGKTAGFTLPLLQRLTQGQRAKPNQVRALILTPTRELAVQVGECVETYAKNLPLNSAVVFGGVKINPQMMKMRKGVDVLVATPGRLLDLHMQNAVKFKQLEILVLDEADRMLDMGFIHDIRRIIKHLPAKRQNLMFSATFSDEIRELAKGIVVKPIEVSVAKPNTTATTVEQWICPVDKKQKPALLSHLILDRQWSQVLVFSRTKHGADRLAKQLIKNNIKSAAIHGNKSQGARTRALADFKRGSVRVLVATDIAARGIDIDQLPQVVNFDLPNIPEDYVHRIGRTGRAGATGQAVSLVSADEFKQLFDIERLIKAKLSRVIIDDFEPDHDVPVSPEPLSTRQGQAKKANPHKKKAAAENSSGGRKKYTQKGRNPRSPSNDENARKQGQGAKAKKRFGKPSSGSSSQASQNQNQSSVGARRTKRKPKPQTSV